MKKVLYPFEINRPVYRETYVYAVKFARNLGAELIMLNAFELNLYDSITQQDYDQLIKENWLKAYNEIIKFNKLYLQNHVKTGPEISLKFNYRFIHGNLLNEIRKILSTEEIELIILPVPDHKDKNQRKLELIRKEIFNKNLGSILAVPCRTSFQPVKNIAFIIDLENLDHSLLYLKDVLRYAKIFNANIHFLYLSQSEKAQIISDNDAYRAVMQIIDSNKNHVFRQICGKDTAGMVDQYTEKNGIQILLLVRHHHHFFNLALHYSICDEMTLKSKIPLLILRERN